VTGSILAATAGSAVNKIQKQGLTRTECRKKSKDSKETKEMLAKAETFTSPNQAGKRRIDDSGTHHSMVIDMVKVEDGITCKHNVSHINMSAHSQIKMKMQYQELKSKYWEITKQVKEVGVPGMDEVAAAFVKEHDGCLFPSNN
jgi:hypothetical protein